MEKECVKDKKACFFLPVLFVPFKSFNEVRTAITRVKVEFFYTYIKKTSFSK